MNFQQHRDAGLCDECAANIRYGCDFIHMCLSIPQCTKYPDMIWKWEPPEEGEKL